MKEELFVVGLALTVYLVSLVHNDQPVPTLAPIYSAYALVLLVLAARSWLS